MAIPNLGDRLSSLELISSSPEEAKAFVASDDRPLGSRHQKLGLKPE